VTKASFLNAVTAYMALGGSTNAAVHLPAMAGRAGIDLCIDELDAIARRVPVIANLYPSGEKLMEDFHYAGGLPAVLNKVAGHLDLTAMTVTGRSLGEEIAGWPSVDDGTILDPETPLKKGTRECPEAGIALAVLRGNLCPDGAVIKPSAATPELLRHTGRALVFESNAQMMAAMADEDLDADESTVLVLRNGGPVGGPGMPEWGNLPIPKKLLRRGVRDMVRISDARMSGTHYGTCVLHVSPESAIGGPLALLRTGDLVQLDIGERRLDMLVPDEELAQRRKNWAPAAQPYTRGYTRIFQREVTQAHLGCDFQSLSGVAPTPEPPIY
jgi:dihydroxy-acid dehydratase